MTPTQAITPAAGQGLLPTSESVMGKDDFLKILVTQLTHQDPINPIKGEEFAAQLAQFSSVEQLHNINSNLENVLDMDLLLNQAINNTLATTLIGKEVTAIGNRVSLHEGESVNLHYRLSSPASKVMIEIKDSAGTLVRTVELQNLSEGNQVLQWDGKDDAGKALAEGQYEFNVSAEDVNGNSVSADPFIVGTINSIRYDNGSAILVLGDLEVNLSDVVEIGLNQPDFKRISVKDQE